MPGRGRCVNGSACRSPHTITCNSLVTPADRGVSNFNRSYGFCALHLKNMACPYKDCVHGLTLASSEADQDEGEEGDVDMSV